MKEIPLTQGYVAIVDDEDYDRVAKHKWYAHVRTREDGSVRVYAMRNIGKPAGGQTVQYIHRFIMDAPSGFDVDHINGNTLDNSKDNMRICTRSQNLSNQRPQTGRSSRFKGIYWYKKYKKWLARIKINGEYKCLGYFIGELDAAKAYDVAAIKLFGEFARVNTYEAQDE